MVVCVYMSSCQIPGPEASRLHGAQEVQRTPLPLCGTIEITCSCRKILFIRSQKYCLLPAGLMCQSIGGELVQHESVAL